MRFEFDPVKSAANLTKHGIDFDRAQSLWEDEDTSRSRPGRRTNPGGSSWAGSTGGSGRHRHAQGASHPDHLDLSSARRPKREVQRVNVDFPAWMVSSLDAEASRLGITRQAVIKTWIAERLDQRAS